MLSIKAIVIFERLNICTSLEHLIVKSCYRWQALQNQVGSHQNKDHVYKLVAVLLELFFVILVVFIYALKGQLYHHKCLLFMEVSLLEWPKLDKYWINCLRGGKGFSFDENLQYIMTVRKWMNNVCDSSTNTTQSLQQFKSNSNPIASSNLCQWTNVHNTGCSNWPLRNVNINAYVEWDQ